MDPSADIRRTPAPDGLGAGHPTGGTAVIEPAVTRPGLTPPGLTQPGLTQPGLTPPGAVDPAVIDRAGLGVQPAPGFPPPVWPPAWSAGPSWQPGPPAPPGQPPMRPVDAAGATGRGPNRTVVIAVGASALGLILVIVLGLLRNGAADDRNLGEIALDGFSVIWDLVLSVLGALN